MKGFWSVVTKRPNVQESEKWGVKCCKVQWSDMMILGEVYVYSLFIVKSCDDLGCTQFVYSYVTVCRICVECYLIIICFSLLFSYDSTYVYNIIFSFVFFCIVFLFSILCILWFYICFLLSCVLFLLLCCLLPIFVQICRPLPPGWNPVAVNKYHISYHIISYHIISYHKEQNEDDLQF